MLIQFVLLLGEGEATQTATGKGGFKSNMTIYCMELCNSPQCSPGTTFSVHEHAWRLNRMLSLASLPEAKRPGLTTVPAPMEHPARQRTPHSSHRSSVSRTLISGHLAEQHAQPFDTCLQCFFCLSLIRIAGKRAVRNQCATSHW